MHRNTYINSPKLLNGTYQLKSNPNIYFAGQITGVEGYVESISSGFVAGINCVSDEKIVFDTKTMIGALADYISAENDKFQPMNANFGILPGLNEKIRNKMERYEKLSQRALNALEQLK